MIKTILWFENQRYLSRKSKKLDSKDIKYIIKNTLEIIVIKSKIKELT